jgi:predicted nuclease of predicted toxin-antitoxin system
LKLLVDENLAPRLAGDLADLFPGSIHVGSADLGSTADVFIWEYAKANHFSFLTKDKDFANLSIAWGPPPQVILLQTGNCSTAAIGASSDATQSVCPISKMTFGVVCLVLK